MKGIWFPKKEKLPKTKPVIESEIGLRNVSIFLSKFSTIFLILNKKKITAKFQLIFHTNLKDFHF